MKQKIKDAINMKKPDIVYRDEWKVLPSSIIKQIKASYAGMYPYDDRDSTKDRSFSEAIKSVSIPLIVWDGNKIKLFDDLEAAKKSALGEYSVVWKPVLIKQNETKTHSWVETKERIFDE